ncbi:thiol reductant ABC exporter subunit CydC [Acetobacter sp. AN02]|uniref:thiol reductant ABC exporter subunit CydC n=1 Tax=Acetobacter sp. AN02 TaxID=2894186 RepID=UPI0024342B1B|nr:thiol reductant ABC exporter subunit CydC [Acetobacter sp. AN02]MDG6093984.1 thiol reductant ABC exporter subunit CydC [Acetobacter sp. AN02]
MRGRRKSSEALADLAGQEEALTDVAAIREVVGLWKPQRVRLVTGVVLSVVALGCGLALMRGAGLRYSGAVTGALVVGSSALAVLGVCRVVFRYAERLYAHGAMFRALADLRVWFFRRLAGGAAAGLGFRRAGELLSRLVSDIEALDGLYLRVLLPAVAACVILPVLWFALARYDVPLASAVVLLFLVSCFVVPVTAMRISRQEGGVQLQALGRLRVGVLDLVSGIREIRAFGSEERMLGRVREADEELMRCQAALAWRMALADGVSRLCGYGAVVLLLLAVTGTGFSVLPVVPAVGLIFLVLAGFESVSSLTRAGMLSGMMGAAARRVVAAAGPEERRVRAGGGALLPAPEETDIRFDSVTFRWREDGPKVLDRLSLDIPAGSRVVILGPSGAGKSSLAALLLKVVSPEGGRILLGGADLASVSDVSVRQRVAWLSQATHLFDDTIRANLLLGRPDASEDDLWRALDDAAVGDVVRELPQGLDTWLGEGGVRVSGGQGRRIALARTLLSGAPVLLLDEPATGLDSQTEMEFLATLNRVAEGRTVILIAHRLTGVEKPDYVWKISEGQAILVS